MSETILKNIDEKLAIIIKLLVAKAFQESTQQDKIVTLSSMGLENNFIAEILGIKSNIVRSAVSREKKKIVQKR